MARAILFDGDDTLWRTEPLYDHARQRARDLVESVGLDGEAWEILERKIDIANVDRFGHALDRFPTSCVEAYEHLCKQEGRATEPVLIEAIRAAAAKVFDDPAPLMPHARETLQALRSQGHLLALLTKGDPILQQQRIEASGLGSMFDVIEIVDQKTPDVIIELLDRLGVAPKDALSVGNSLRSDIKPALAVGVQPIWIDAHVWEYERSDDPVGDDVIALHDLSELVRVAS